MPPQVSWEIVDGNLPDLDVADAIAAHVDARAVTADPVQAVAMTVMPGPQLVSAVPLAKAVKQRFPGLPMIWGGNFGSLYPDPVLNAPYVDWLVRGQGHGADQLWPRHHRHGHRLHRIGGPRASLDVSGDGLGHIEVRQVAVDDFPGNLGRQGRADGHDRQGKASVRGAGGARVHQQDHGRRPTQRSKRDGRRARLSAAASGRSSYQSG